MRKRIANVNVALAAAFVAGCALSLTAPASASTCLNPGIYSLPCDTPANQNWIGSVGLDFTVNSNVVVYGLGAFTNGAIPIDVAIYNATNGSPIAGLSTTITTAPNSSKYAFQPVTPVILTPGSYQVTAWGYATGNNNNYNTGLCGGGYCPKLGFNTLGGELTFGLPYYSNSTGFATILDDFWPGGGPYDPFHYYGAGNFEASAATPLPSTWAMLIAGFVGLGFFAYRGTKRRAAAIVAA
jgi:hypothetical protein